MHSMTGFGRGTHATTHWRASVELASVNRKQAEILIQSNRPLGEAEARARQALNAVVSRGRVQASIRLDAANANTTALYIDTDLARELHRAIADLSTATGLALSPSVSDFLRHPGILTTDEAPVDAEIAWQAIEPALSEAITAFNHMRSMEGAHLRDDIETRISTLVGFVARIAESAPGRMDRAREQLHKRLCEAGLDIDLTDERVLKEIALFADRCDISEEITRLHSHFSKFRDYLAAGDVVGRPLDFLCQELFREFNTIASKSNDAGIAQLVVEAKTDIEKIREQVQNIE